MFEIMAHKSPISDAAFDSESQPPQGMGAGTYGDMGSSFHWGNLLNGIVIWMGYKRGIEPIKIILNFFQISRIFFWIYFIKMIKNPQTTVDLTFLTHIISGIRTIHFKRQHFLGGRGQKLVKFANK